MLRAYPLTTTLQLVFKSREIIIARAVGSAASLLGGAISDKYDKTIIMMGAHFGVTITTILLAVGKFSSEALLLILILHGVARYLPVRTRSVDKHYRSRISHIEPNPVYNR